MVSFVAWSGQTHQPMKTVIAMAFLRGKRQLVYGAHSATYSPEVNQRNELHRLEPIS